MWQEWEGKSKESQQVKEIEGGESKHRCQAKREHSDGSGHVLASVQAEKRYAFILESIKYFQFTSGVLISPDWLFNIVFSGIFTIIW